MSDPMHPDDSQLIALQSRQRKTLLLLATALIVGGLLILFVLKKMPLPMRILAGLGDVVGGCVLLVVARQKFGKPGPPAGP